MLAELYPVWIPCTKKGNLPTSTPRRGRAMKYQLPRGPKFLTKTISAPVVTARQKSVVGVEELAQDEGLVICQGQRGPSG